MSNTMYLVCTHHPDRVHSFRLASRGTATQYLSHKRVEQKLEDWFSAHRLCGGGLDHFTIAFDLPKDHDLPKIEPVANGVHLALAKGAEIARDAANLIEFNEGRRKES